MTYFVNECCLRRCAEVFLFDGRGSGGAEERVLLLLLRRRRRRRRGATQRNTVLDHCTISAVNTAPPLTTTAPLTRRSHHRSLRPVTVISNVAAPRCVLEPKHSIKRRQVRGPSFEKTFDIVCDPCNSDRPVSVQTGLARLSTLLCNHRNVC